MNLVQTSVSSKGQMVLPAKLRARYNITQGTRITLVCDDAGFYVRKTNKERVSDLNTVVGILSKLAAQRAPRRVSDLSDDEHIGSMLLAEDERIKQSASAVNTAERKRLKPLNLNP
jgi:bifunctional DNA-binding transcriptional regulator/antitoxin component of YhaV-PrlF toxin-antitoxin module